MNRIGLGIGLIFLCTGCIRSPGQLPPCDSWESRGSFCQLMNPEDLSPLPTAGWIVTSEMTHSDPREDPETKPFKPGRLTALRLSESGGEAERRVLYPQEWLEAAPDGNRWGEASCAGPPTRDDFQPHGIDVGPGPEGSPALAVVTHGEREVIDLFEIGTGSEPKLFWRGCVPVPEAVMANDVALLDGGAMLITNFMPRFEKVGFSAAWSLIKISVGAKTGSVLRYEPGGQFIPIPGSGGSAPNGIAASRDGRTVYVAEWGGGKVYRLRLNAGARTPPRGGESPSLPQRDEIKVDGSPDNLTWAANGDLLVAAQKAGPIKALGCGQIQAGGCDLGYSVTRIDPETFVGTKIAEGRGAASVALEVEQGIYIGVFAGDAITPIPIDDKALKAE